MWTATGERTWLVGLVIGHLLATFVHGGAHVGAHVATTPLQNVFIWLVIEIGPVVGLALVLVGRSSGGWLVAATMVGALAFGVVNHFVLAGADRVDYVTGPWRLPFVASASVLAISEAAGAVAGTRYAMRRMEPSS
jgi:hypothetical protein